MTRPLLLALLAIPAIGGLAPLAHAQNAAMPDASELLGRIMEADANGDGRVTRPELLAYRAKQFGRLDRNGDGFIDAGDVPGIMASHFEPRLRMLVNQFDANHDGRVSHDEFVNGPTLGFDMADANHDGVVTRDEINAALARVRTQRAEAR